MDEIERRGGDAVREVMAELDRRRKLAIMLDNYDLDKVWTCPECTTTFVVGEPTSHVFSEFYALWCAHCTELKTVLEDPSIKIGRME